MCYLISASFVTDAFVLAVLSCIGSSACFARLIKKARIKETAIMKVETKKVKLIPSNMASSIICCCISAVGCPARFVNNLAVLAYERLDITVTNKPVPIAPDT